MSLNCICPVLMLTPGNSMNFDRGAVGKAASDFVDGSQESLKKGL